MAYLCKLDDPAYTNWIKAGLGLIYGRDILRSFLLSSFTKFRNNILIGNSTQNCNQCTLLNVLPCPTNGICSHDKRGNCRAHTSLDPSATTKPCPDNVCNALLQAILTEHIQGRGPRWTGSDTRQWCSNVWEIAKCFMPPGNENKHDYSEFDFSGIMTMVMNSKFIQRDIAGTYDAKTFQRVSEI